jgi:hypothetical protein
MNEMKSLSASQLAAIDFMITRAQERGVNPNDKIYYVAESDTVGLVDAHGGLFALAEDDRRIVDQMRELARQLQHSVSLGDLLKARAELVRSLNRG